MKKKLIYCFLFIFITGISFECLAQKHGKKLNIIEAKWDTIIHAPVIPDNIFKLKADGLVIPDRQCRVKNCPKSSFYIFWSSQKIDGEFKLIITQKQIILTTGHDNPNADDFYWFVNITGRQFQTITQKINNSKDLFDEQDLIRSFHRQLEYKKFILELKQSNQKDFLDKKYLNTKRLIDFFNKDVTLKDQINFPDQEKFQSNKPIMEAGMASEITDFIIKY